MASYGLFTAPHCLSMVLSRPLRGSTASSLPSDASLGLVTACSRLHLVEFRLHSITDGGEGDTEADLEARSKHKPVHFSVGTYTIGRYQFPPGKFSVWYGWQKLGFQWPVEDPTHRMIMPFAMVHGFFTEVLMHAPHVAATAAADALTPRTQLVVTHHLGLLLLPL
jgi:hypothetical protein